MKHQLRPNIIKNRRFVNGYLGKKSNNFLPQKLEDLTASVEHLSKELNTISVQMSHNGKSLTTFGAGNRAMRSVDPCPKCGVAKPHKGRKPDWGFAEPEATEGSGALNGCYATFEQKMPQHIIKSLIDEYRKVQYILEVYDNGEMKKVSGASMGNKVYAWRMEQHINELFKAQEWETKKVLFLTLTSHYIKTEHGRQESWERFKANTGKFVRKMKENGMEKYFTVFEAHKDGGCHCHLIAKFNRELPLFKLHGKIRLANTPLRQIIKDNWAGYVEIEGLKDDGAKAYLQKYLGKFSHIEDSLKRAKRNWEKEGDARHKETDYKKLWTIYWCKKLKMRRFRSSEKRITYQIRMDAEKETKKAVDQPPDLIKEMNKLTEGNRPQLIKRIIITRQIRNNPAFEPFNGRVEQGSREYDMFKNFLGWIGGEK